MNLVGLGQSRLMQSFSIGKYLIKKNVKKNYMIVMILEFVILETCFNFFNVLKLKIEL